MRAQIARMVDTLEHFSMADGAIVDGPEWGYEIAPHHQNHRSYIFNDLPENVAPLCADLGYDYGALVAASEQAMRASGDTPDAFFHRHRGGRDADGSLADALSDYEASDLAHPYWSETPETMVIEEVERIWSAIERDDDWQPLSKKVAAIRRMGEAHGTPPRPAGH